MRTMSAATCRACLASEGPLSNIAHDDMIKTAFLDLAGVVVSIDDGLPQAICNKCLILLNEFISFREKIIKNNDYLLHLRDENLLLYEQTEKQTDKEMTEPTLEDSDIKTEPIIRKEIEVMYLDTLDKNDLDDHSFANDEDFFKNSKKEKGSKVKKKSKKSKKEKLKPKKTPRVLIHVDPEKITTIRLTREEQLRRQRAEAEREEYRSMPYKCEKCFKGFNYERKLNSHIENYHKPNSEFKCPVCTRTMSNAASLGLHVKKHELIYECNICRSSFIEKPRAISHYKSAHEGIEAELPCKQCGRIFRNRSTLYGHIRNHHPRTERPTCTHCNKSFVSKDSLDDHMLIHTGERNYPCGVCGRRFRLRQCARAHAASHSPSRPHRCSACDAAFKCRSAYIQHLNTARAHVTDDVRAKNACTTCGRQFSTRYALRQHAARVHGPRATRATRATRAPRGAARDARVAAVCHYCGRGFSARRTLENHILVHTGVKPHSCQHCGARFTQRATLRTHMRRRHPDNTSGQKVES